MGSSRIDAVRQRLADSIEEELAKDILQRGEREYINPKEEIAPSRVEEPYLKRTTKTNVEDYNTSELAHKIDKRNKGRGFPYHVVKLEKHPTFDIDNTGKEYDELLPSEMLEDRTLEEFEEMEKFKKEKTYGSWLVDSEGQDPNLATITKKNAARWSKLKSARIQMARERLKYVRRT